MLEAVLHESDQTGQPILIPGLLAHQKLYPVYNHNLLLFLYKPIQDVFDVQMEDHKYLILYINTLHNLIPITLAQDDNVLQLLHQYFI